MKFKVMTYNIQHGRNHNLKGDNIDLDLIASTVERYNPNIVGFNEVRKGIDNIQTPNFDNQPKVLGEKLKGYCYFGKAIEVKKDCEYGNAVFSKKPLESFEVIKIPDPQDKIEGYFYESRCITKSVVCIGGVPITILTSHFGLAPNEQENAVETLLSIASKIKIPLIFMGDLNMTDDNPLIQKLSECFTDALKSIRQDKPTFPSDSPKIRIDYIFYKDLKLVEAETECVVSSDHYPLTAVFDIV